MFGTIVFFSNCMWKLTVERTGSSSALFIWVKLQKRGAASDDLELGIYCQGHGHE